MQPTTPKKPSPFARLKSWLHQHPKATYILIGLGLIIAASITVFALLWQEPKPAPVVSVPKPKPIEKFYSPLTGIEVADKATATKPVTAIMIENSPDARPQSGLKQAEVVYEAVAEGGITRFLALYQTNKPKLIGPVRSVRMYYVDWLAPYNASVAHVGGSFNALKVVRGKNFRDIDQFFYPGAYWRASDRFAPHNVYTSSAKLDALNKAKGYKTSEPKPLLRDTTAKPPKKLTAKVVNLNISDALYNSAYTYDVKTARYYRNQAGAAHIDREKGRISTKVVVALLVNMKQVLEDGYRESITTTGKGTAYVFQNGQVKKVTWHKTNRQAQLEFTDAAGEPFALERGTTWISAIPKNDGSVTWK